MLAIFHSVPYSIQSLLDVAPCQKKKKKKKKKSTCFGVLTNSTMKETAVLPKHL
jgi:hypothetical protein